MIFVGIVSSRMGRVDWNDLKQPAAPSLVVSSRMGRVDWNFPVFHFSLCLPWSLPVWEEWIEIGSLYNPDGPQIVSSRMGRVDWNFGKSGEAANVIVSSRMGRVDWNRHPADQTGRLIRLFPYGKSGLKSLAYKSIRLISCLFPYGKSGLKSLPGNPVNRLYRLFPYGKSGLKLTSISLKKDWKQVSSRMGRVDWNLKSVKRMIRYFVSSRMGRVDWNRIAVDHGGERLLSLPVWEEWIEIGNGRYSRRNFYVSSRMGRVDWNALTMVNIFYLVVSSRMGRVDWNIFVTGFNRRSERSLPVWEEWIEISYPICLDFHDSSLFPYGKSGLKYRHYATYFAFCMSLPVWEEWIEIRKHGKKNKLHRHVSSRMGRVDWNVDAGGTESVYNGLFPYGKSGLKCACYNQNDTFACLFPYGKSGLKWRWI